MNKKKFSGVLTALKYFLFPKRCYLCGKVITPESDFCMSCDDKDFRVEYPTEKFVRNERDIKYKFSRLVAPFYYEGEVRNCIHLYKYSGFYYIGKYLAYEMAQAVKSEYDDEKIDYAICVPSTRKRKKERGFSQGDDLLKHIKRICDFSCVFDMIVKTRETVPQMTLSGKERLTNLKDAFSFTGKYDIKGKTVLICDDVKTTGSTLNECASVLLSNGAKKVICVSAAVTNYI